MAFYQCPKCKKVWQYPIKKCPDCFFDLKIIKGEKIKVIGISKVNVPTLLHPVVPYFVLVLEDEYGNRWVQKSTKEYKIGEEFKFEAKKDQNAVAIWRIKYDILEAIEKVIELIGGVEINSETKILILPTLISPKHPHFAENTSPQFLRFVIEYLLKKGANANNIKVGGQSFNEFPIEASAQKSQLLNICQENKILPLNLAEKKFLKKGELEISEEAFQNNLIINLPIMKLDKGVGVKGALFNLLKLLKKENYLSLKYLSSDEEIMKKLNETLPKILNIAEANRIQKSDKLTTFLGICLSSWNPVSLDRVFAEICQIGNLPEFLKEVKIEGIKILGREIKEVGYEVDKYHY